MPQSKVLMRVDSKTTLIAETIKERIGESLHSSLTKKNSFRSQNSNTAWKPTKLNQIQLANIGKEIELILQDDNPYETQISFEESEPSEMAPMEEPEEPEDQSVYLLCCEVLLLCLCGKKEIRVQDKKKSCWQKEERAETQFSYLRDKELYMTRQRNSCGLFCFRLRQLCFTKKRLQLLPWAQMDQGQRNDRIKSLWRMARSVVLAFIFVYRLKRHKKLKFQSRIVLSKDKGVSSHFKFLIDPEKSRFFFLWLCLMNCVFWYDMLSTPVLLIWPELAFRQMILTWTCDAFWLANIFINFITIKPNQSRDLLEIALYYMRRLFVVDLLATLPPILSSHNINVKFVRILHFPQIYELILPLTWLLNKLLPYNKHLLNTYHFLIVFLLHLILVIHYFICIWLYVGVREFFNDNHFPWVLNSALLITYDYARLFIFTMYWMCTVIFTVGYGDYTGGTMIEYCLSILFELTAVAMMSVVMFMINNIAQMYSQQPYQDIDRWVHNLERCNKPRHITATLYQQVHAALSDSLVKDFNCLIEGYDFYQRLRPGMQTQFVQQLFKTFLSDFDHFFKDLEVGFTNELILNLYARSYHHGQDIYKPGAEVDELLFITKGNIQICEPTQTQEPFCVLPTFCVTHDHQILSGMPSFFAKKALAYGLDIVEKNDSAYAVIRQNEQSQPDTKVELMCCSKQKFLEICNVFPKSAAAIKQQAKLRHQMLIQFRKSKQKELEKQKLANKKPISALAMALQEAKRLKALEEQKQQVPEVFGMMQQLSYQMLNQLNEVNSVEPNDEDSDELVRTKQQVNKEVQLMNAQVDDILSAMSDFKDVRGDKRSHFLSRLKNVPARLKRWTPQDEDQDVDEEQSYQDQVSVESSAHISLLSKVTRGIQIKVAVVQKELNARHAIQEHIKQMQRMLLPVKDAQGQISYPGLKKITRKGFELMAKFEQLAKTEVAKLCDKELSINESVESSSLSNKSSEHVHYKAKTTKNQQLPSITICKNTSCPPTDLKTSFSPVELKQKNTVKNLGTME